jgi:hypothetical protein
MRAGALLIVALALGLFAGGLHAAPVQYLFGGGPPITCKAPNSLESGVPGGLTAPICNDTETFEAVGGGFPVDVTAMPSFGAPDFNPYGGLGVFDVGIGVGNKGDSPLYGPSPGKSKISKGTTPANPSTIEMVQLSWGGTPAFLHTVSVRSYTTAAQAIRILGGNGNPLTTNLWYVGGAAGPVTTFTFSQPLLASAFLVEPSFVLEGNQGGFFLVGAEVQVIPVPPALPLLGGAMVLLFWRARRAKSPAA